MKSQTILCLVILALLSITVLSACTWKSPSGVAYDFSAGKHPELVTTADNYSYTFSFCGGKPVNTQCAAATNSPNACLIEQPDHYWFALSRWSATTAITDLTTNPSIVEKPDGGLTLTFTNGDTYPSGQQSQLVVDLTCSKTPIASKMDSSIPLIHLNIAHPLACPSDSGLSGGALFLIIFFSVLAGYFIFGFLICKFALKKEGLDAIPQRAFWCCLIPAYIAGIKCVIGKITGKGSSGSSDSSNYSENYGATEDVYK